jgi:hypothetical protein
MGERQEVDCEIESPHLQREWAAGHQFRDREWWRKEAARCGSDWAGITRLLRERINYLQHLIADTRSCDICGASPCVNPAFCNTVRVLGGMSAAGES